MAKQKILTLKNVVDAKIRTFNFTGEFYGAFGCPRMGGLWYVYGGSGSGKTSFILSLMKEMAPLTNKILFESYEEGVISLSFQKNIKRLGMLSLNNKIQITDESLEEMIERLNFQRSPDVVFIDSLEHSEFKNIKQITDLRDRYPQKTFVFVGQASGLRPRTELGESVLFIADQKIHLEGYRAISRGRSFGSAGYYTIWGEEAAVYWEK